IDTTGYAIYSLLIRMANESSGESCYPGYTLMESHLAIGRSTVSYYISLLEWCQLIYRDRPEIVVIQNGERKKLRQGNRSNTYYILDVMSVTPKRLEKVRAKVQESINQDGGGLTTEWGEKFIKAIDSWKPLQFHWASRRRKKIKTVVGQPSLFEPVGNNDDGGALAPPANLSQSNSVSDKSKFLVKTKKILSDFGIVGSPAKELANMDEPLVLAWVWQCQIEEMDAKKAPGYVVKRLRQNDSPGEDQINMAHHWLTMKAEDRESLREKAERLNWRSNNAKLSENVHEDFMPDLMGESMDYYQRAYKVGALYTDI
ncbi:MAG: hypothetical protein KC413_18930, partial [Anaerolineales bacterium]|nr:hypothetical protein [Anaerolineales bacterium]